MTKVLFQHQALVDSIVCLMGIGMITQPCMWMSGNQTFDFLLCQVWHSQGLYWTWVLLSIWNIMYISVERFIKINYPCRHRHTPVRDVCRGFTILYILGFLCLIPEYFQVRYDTDEGKCFADFYKCSEGFKMLMDGWRVVWFLISYIIPIATFIGIYVTTILTIEKRKGNLRNQCRDSFTASQLYEKESKYITRTVVAVAIVFVLSLSWETLQYLLSAMGVAKYHKNDPLQRIGVFLATFNSCVNPFIYCVFLKCFRNSLKNTFKCQKPDDDCGDKKDEISVPLSKLEEDAIE